MDNSWQSKCSSSWPLLPSSSQLPPQGSRNQMAMNAGQNFHPYVAQELRSMNSGVIQDSMVFNTLDIGSCRPEMPELGNSFLALLSGPSPQIQCEVQHLSSSKPSMDSTKLPMPDNGLMAGGDGCGVQLSPVGLLSQRQGYENMGSGVEHVPLISSRTASTSACSFVSDLNAKLQMGNLNRYNSEITKQDIHHRVQGNQTGVDLSSPQWGWLTRTNFPSVGQHNLTNVQASMKVPSNRKSFVSDHSSAFASGRPRVFCLATRGDLLISNTFLLGVVCSCHGSHMSITTFCEHSGLCAVNPGDAVRLESGETVAQWRRLYFLKFGIRVPDDNSGWDWPDGISAAGGLVKCKASVPNTSKNSEMLRRIDPFVGSSARSGQPWNGFVSPNNSHAEQSLLEKPSKKVMHTPQQRNTQEGCDVLLKSLLGTTHNILSSQLDIPVSQIMKESPMPGGLAMSTSLEKGRKDSGYQSISDYIDFLTKSGNSFISNQGLGNLKFLGTDSDVSRCNNSREAFIMDRDAISSNIELRLGQPSQQSNTMGASVMSSMRSRTFDTLGDCQKSLFQDPLIHNTVNPRVAEESRQNILRCSPSNTALNSRRENECQSNLTNHPPGICSTLDLDKLEQFRGAMAKSSLVSMYLSQFSTSTEKDLHFRAPTNMVDNSCPSTSRILHGESHSFDFRSNGSDEMGRQLNFSGLGFLNNVDKGKGAQHNTDTCSYMAAKTSLFHNKQMADSSPFTGLVSGNHIPSTLTAHEKPSSYVCQSSSIIQDASNARNQSNQFTKVSCHGNSSDPAFLRSANSSTVIAGAGSVMPMGLSSTNSICRPNLTPASSNNVGIGVSPYFMDENLRLLALRRALDLSKQGHAIASLETRPEQGRIFGPSSIEMQRRGSSADRLASEELREGPYLTVKQNASEVAGKPVQSCSNHYADKVVEKLADVSGVSNWCNFLTSPRGVFNSKELDMQNPPHESLTDKQPLLRLGRIENDATVSGEHETCSQKEPNVYFSGKCSCAAHPICLVGNCVPRGDTLVDACKGHVGKMSDNASTLGASIFDKGHMILEGKATPVAQCENLKRQIPMQNDPHTSQWRDVPRKRIGNDTCIERPAKVSNTRGSVEDQLVDTACKGFNGTEEAESLNEQQMSNVCSGCSAPAVTEVSIEVNNMDSCTVDAGDARYVNDLVVDEGSGIQKCWSSDDALDSVRSTETINVSGRFDSRKGGSTSGLSNLSSQGLIDDLRLGNSFILKKVQNRLATEKMSHTQQHERHLKAGKRKRAVKWKRLDSSFPPSGLSSVNYDSPKSTRPTELHSCSSREILISSRSNHGRPLTCISSNGPSSLKRKRSALYSAKTLSWNRDPRGQHDHHQDSEDDCLRIPKPVGEEKLKQGWTADMSREFWSQEMNQVDARKAAKQHSLGCVNNFSSHEVDAFEKKTRPVVCGNSGIIYNGKLTESPAKPAKIVSLKMIYKTTRRLTVSENEERTSSSMLETKKACFRRSNDKLSISKKEKKGEAHKTIPQNEDDPVTSTFESKKACFSGNDLCMAEISMLKKVGEDEVHKTLKDNILHRFSSARLKSRFKEPRKRSLYELAGKGNNPNSSKLCLPKISKCSLQTRLRSRGKSCLKNVDVSQSHIRELCQVNAKSIKERKCQASISDSDAFCCVCGSSNNDEINCLLECSCCLVRVHQACYGVSKVPKGRWCCRPCKMNSKNIVCVLCGYKGGAMTRALRCQNVVKSLLKAWNISVESKSTNFIPLSKDLSAELGMVDASRPGHEIDSASLMGSMTEESPTAVLKIDLHNKQDVIKNSYDLPRNFPVHNTITEGALDPTITQWVHMVCGLWTPGTRCPNVDTMSAFDVSGASRPPKNVVCSICNRPGGSCIKCRIGNCSVHFHPWCAHQKGLLQSEVEGVDNEKVGFYGRCMLHAVPHGCDSNCHPMDTYFESLGNGEFTCARTEGYKGRKKDGFRHKLHGQSNENGGCLVPQEQINAWLHINGQKSSTRGLLKPLASDIEYDCRKEYARYKQAKGWKHLVVYKSGIHALGLYTARFISRGAMVVEYVGEIVGLRVADKREIEYQSGRKLQYKSACYFFRIDKEHIIDATRKGGIARFVNHSCLPNCVAKVISVRNEKKVVFFAERDINPGEEITYDYHFNHEDEGKKIPCFCNSKNCRRYLN